jgi:hypothetical protein
MLLGLNELTKISAINKAIFSQYFNNVIKDDKNHNLLKNKKIHNAVNYSVMKLNNINKKVKILLGDRNYILSISSYF